MVVREKVDIIFQNFNYKTYHYHYMFHVLPPSLTEPKLVCWSEELYNLIRRRARRRDRRSQEERQEDWMPGGLDARRTRKVEDLYLKPD